ncbi:MAG TPA: 30S ribosomal protein S20 [Rickettsiales bacterium]|nr:30S ribosomal protein S20 [Rickettsiales bacterium]
MANTSAAKKALRSSARKNTINTARKSRIRTFAKKVVESIQAGDKTKAQADLKAFESEIMSGVSKKVFKLNTASRKISRFAGQIRKIEVKK